MIRLALYLSICVAALAPVFGADAGSDPNSFAGPLDEGKTYRKVDNITITGREIADVVIEDRWEEEVSSFVKQVVVEEALEKQKIKILPGEEEAEMKRITADWARSVGKDIQNTKPEEMALATRTSMASLREEIRNVTALKKLLIADQKATELSLTDLSAEGMQKTTQAMQSWLENKIKEKEVVVDPKRLGEGEALRIGGRPYAHQVLREYILRRLGSLKVGEIHNMLYQLTLERLVQEKLKNLGLETMSKQDSTFHLSYLCRRMQYEDKNPDPLETLKVALRSKNASLSVEKWMENRTFIMDAAISKLARRTVGKKAIEEEWKVNSTAYQVEAKYIAHIFIAVRDPEGRKYNLFWRAGAHKDLNDYVGKLREEQFTAAKPRIEQLVGSAHADFEKTVREASEDETSKVTGGRIHDRIGEGLQLQKPFDDLEFVKQVMKLKPGEISPPLRSVYGWHLVKCLENQETKFEELKTQEHIYEALLGRKRKEVMAEFQSIMDDKQRCVDTY